MKAKRGRTTLQEDGNNQITDVDPVSPAAADDPNTKIESFFDRVSQLTDAEWEQHELYLYRVAPKIDNQRGHSYIDTYMNSVTLADIKKKWGGGTYKVYLKNKADRTKNSLPYYFTVSGRPVLEPDHVLVQDDKNGAAPVPSVAQSSNGTGDHAAVATLGRIAEQKSTEQITTESAVDVVTNVYNKATDAILSRLGNPNAGDDKMELFKMMMMMQQENTKLMMAMQAESNKMMIAMITNKAPASDGGGLGGLINSLPDLLNKLKSIGLDLPAEFKAVRELIANRPAAAVAAVAGEGENEVSALTSIAREVAPQIPAIVDAIGSYQERSDTARMRRQHEELNLEARRRSMGISTQTNTNQNQQQPPPPAQQTNTQQVDGRVVQFPPQPAPVVNREPAPAPGTALPGGIFQQPTTAMPAGEIIPPNHAAGPVSNGDAKLMDVICTRIVTLFNEGVEGDVVAQGIDLMYPEVVDSIAPLMGNKDLAQAWVKNDPILSQISSHANFPEFFEAFTTFITSTPEEETTTDPVPA